MSFTSLLTTKGYSLQNKISTSPISQSLRCLEKQGLQLPKSPPSSQASDTQPSLFTANRNKLGKASFKVWSSHHKSFQNLTLLSFPTIKWDISTMTMSSSSMQCWHSHSKLNIFLARKFGGHSFLIIVLIIFPTFPFIPSFTFEGY